MEAFTGLLCFRKLQMQLFLYYIIIYKNKVKVVPISALIFSKILPSDLLENSHHLMFLVAINTQSLKNYIAQPVDAVNVVPNYTLTLPRHCWAFASHFPLQGLLGVNTS